MLLTLLGLFYPAAAAKSLQSCPTLCDPIDGSPPGSPAPGILQARTLEWVAISFSDAWKWKVKRKSLSCVRLLVTPWITAYQAPPSMGFSRQEYWSGVPLPSLSESHSLLYFLPFQATRYFLQTLGWQYANKPTLQFCNLLPGLEEFEAPLFPEFLPLFTSSWEVKKETGNAYYTLGTVR